MKLKEKLTEWMLLFYLGLIIAGLLASVVLASVVLFLIEKPGVVKFYLPERADLPRPLRPRMRAPTSQPLLTKFTATISRKRVKGPSGESWRAFECARGQQKTRLSTGRSLNISKLLEACRRSIGRRILRCGKIR
jgi:hypothetical protein